MSFCNLIENKIASICSVSEVKYKYMIRNSGTAKLSSDPLVPRRFVSFHQEKRKEKRKVEGPGC